MDATVQIDDELFQRARSEAARHGMTVREWVEAAVSDRLTNGDGRPASEVEERRRRFEELRAATAHFRVGPRPGRDEMNER